MFMLARLKAAKWKLLGGVVVIIVLCGVVTRFLSSTAPSSPPESSLSPLVAVNAVEKKESDLLTNVLPPATEMQVRKNPKTGRFEKPPVGSSIGREPSSHPAPSGALGPTPTAPQLSEWLSPVGGGGVVTNVRLRFRRPLVATKDADGVLTIQHAPEAADAESAR
jgi:hypothetical protein